MRAHWRISLGVCCLFARVIPAQDLLRAWNLGGLEIQGEKRAWAAFPTAPGMSAFANTGVELSPPVADPGLARLIRSSLWSSSGDNRLALEGLPDGPCTVFLYVWEDNHAQTYSVFLNESAVLDAYSSGSAGTWQRLGPWHSQVKNGQLALTSRGGHANWSGLEIWKGHLAAHPDDPPRAARNRIQVAPNAWWALQPLREPGLPAVPNGAGVRNPVDRFLLASLHRQDLAPAPEADRRTLLRRLSFDLTGLPPSPEEVDAFVADPAPDAYERRVESLLASPQFGVAWARHWMDVIRFGESQGFERNRVREEAWRYRDWLVNAFNADMPYDEFIRSQIAGDVLVPGDLDALLATGFLVCGTWDQVGHVEGSPAMRAVAREEHLEDLVGMIGQAVLGLTVHCARCHDHKFDPIPQEDYFRFVALLSGVHQQEEDRKDLPVRPSAGTPPFTGKAHVPVLRTPAPTRILDRGDPSRPGETVVPAGLTCIQGVEPDFSLPPHAVEAERRRQLALWLTDPANPLTPRVQVNRIWQQVFGTGLVATPGDFGAQGSPPSHPELLDWLAARFRAEGYHVKSMIRLLVGSTTYRQRSDVAQGKAQAVDPSVSLRWRAPMRRLRAEELRDAMLWAAGVLSLDLGGPSFRDFRLDVQDKNHRFVQPLPPFAPAFHRRTLYRMWARSAPVPLLAGFDCPDPSVQSHVRATTTTPLQALTLLNGPFSRGCAEALATRLARATPGSPEEQCRQAYRRLFARPPGAGELAEARDHAGEHGLASLCLVLLNSNEFLFLP